MASANEGAVVSQADLTALAERLSQVERYLHVDEKRLRPSLRAGAPSPAFGITPTQPAPLWRSSPAAGKT